MADKDLKNTVSNMLALTGEPVNVDDIAVCHRLMKRTTVILEFHRRDKRDNVVKGRKNLKDKRAELSEMGLSKSYVTESMTREHRRLDYLCRVLKKTGIYLGDMVLQWTAAHYPAKRR